MKKILLIAAAILFLSVAQASAQKVYVGMNDYGDEEVYILTETIRNVTWQGHDGFSVFIADSNGNSPSMPWNYVYINGQWRFLLSLDENAYPMQAKGIVLKVAQVANRYR